MRSIVILGSTGSIGQQALDVIARYPDEYRVVGLSAHNQADLLAKQAATLPVPPLTTLTSRDGLAGLLELCRLDEADTVINALVGSIGLRPTLESLQAGKKLLLANKESLVAGGELVLAAAGKQEIIPIDSEHSALFQCLRGEDPADVAKLIITASGGPFRGRSRTELSAVTLTEALAHPRWTMGPKITIDSATMMNKGLEVIEAHYLFGMPYENIDVVVHPQSIVHSLVEYVDGSVIGHLGPTDMRVPIQYALTYPRRQTAPAGTINLIELARLDFEAPDNEAFPALSYAYQAGRTGGTAPAVLNAANEAAVAAFRAGACGFSDIADCLEDVLNSHSVLPADSVDVLEEAERWARERAASWLAAWGN